MAWETARRLEERGEEVALLALIDSRPPDPAAAIADLGDEIPDLALRARLEAARSYRPGPVAGPVALFLAGDRSRAENAEAAALWLPLAPGGLDVEILPGDHFSLLREPGVAALAESIRRRLETLDRPAD